MHARTLTPLLVAFVIAFTYGGVVGVALATHGHDRNGIYHGPYFEYRSGADYHHSWTEHDHDGYRWVGIFTSSGDKVAAGSNSDGNYRTEHVHKTAYFNSFGHSKFKTNNPQASNQCHGEAATSSYSDGHGICKHRMDAGPE